MQTPDAPRARWGVAGARLLLATAAAMLLPGCGHPARTAPLPPVAAIHLGRLPSPVTQGTTVDVTAVARAADGQPVFGAPLQAYLNGKAWGAPEATDARGTATLPLPLPSVGPLRLRVATTPRRTDWIWARRAGGLRLVYLMRTFDIPAKLLPTPAARLSATGVLRVVADRAFVAYLNGHRVTSATALAVRTASGLQEWLHAGRNVLALEAWGGATPGVAAKLALHTFTGTRTVRTDAAWRAFATRPHDWPARPRGGRRLPLRLVAPAGGGPWLTRPIRGAGALGLTGSTPGAAEPAGLVRSPAARLVVKPAHLSMPSHPRHAVGMEYEPWFSPLNLHWQSAEAVPLLGRYSSADTAVLRQHALWLDRAGIDFVLVDWSNNLWGKTAWAQRAPNVDQIVANTTVLLHTYAAMRAQGLPTPQVTLLLGLDNGPHTTTTALNEEMAWIDQHYVRNPRYRGLWVRYRGKPLLLLFNGGGPAVLTGQPPVSTAHFTVRWMASQLQANHLQTAGYWSWMDGSVHPVLTGHAGRPEALTVTPAFFGSGGWTGSQALGRLGGTTYLREFAVARRDRPRFLLINQFNEFAGQSRSAAVHVDTYTEQLSDDIEPTSLSDCGYASCGGWGFYYLNLTRALVRMYHDPATPRSTLLAVGHPLRGAPVCGPALTVDWRTLGAPPTGFRVSLDGHTVAPDTHGSTISVPLRGLARGAHTLTVQALGAASRYVLSRRHFGHVLAHRRPVLIRMAFTYRGRCATQQPTRAPAVPAGVARPGSTAGDGVDLNTLASGTIDARHAAVGPLQGGQTLAEVFRVPVPLVSVAATTPTWAHTGSGGTLVLRTGAGLHGRVLARHTFTGVADNAWLTLRLSPAVPPGRYTLVLQDPTGPAIGWWGSAAMVPGDYALRNGRRQAQELVIRYAPAAG